MESTKRFKRRYRSMLACRPLPGWQTELSCSTGNNTSMSYISYIPISLYPTNAVQNTVIRKVSLIMMMMMLIIIIIIIWCKRVLFVWIFFTNHPSPLSDAMTNCFKTEQEILQKQNNCFTSIIIPILSQLLSSRDQSPTVSYISAPMLPYKNSRFIIFVVVYTIIIIFWQTYFYCSFIYNNPIVVRLVLLIIVIDEYNLRWCEPPYVSKSLLQRVSL